jgi:hypothetical protein
MSGLHFHPRSILICCINFLDYTVLNINFDTTTKNTVVSGLGNSVTTIHPFSTIICSGMLQPKLATSSHFPLIRNEENGV